MIAKKSTSRKTAASDAAQATADVPATGTKGAKSARRATKAAPSDAEQNVQAEIAAAVSETPTTPEAAQEQAHAVDAARAKGAVAASERKVGALGTGPAGAPRPASSVTTEPTGPADTDGADDDAVNYIHDDATRNTTELREQALRDRKARQSGGGR